MPEIKALIIDKEHKIRVSYYEGLAVIKEMYERVYENKPNKEFIGFSVHGDDAPKELLDFLKQQNEEYKKLKIRRRIITAGEPENRQALSVNKKGRQNNIATKALLKLKDNRGVSIEIYKNYIQIISLRDSQAIVIDSQDAAQVLKQIFNIIWESDNRSKDKGFDKNAIRIV
ncbi:hypothetical protein K8R32_00165 [bacterium]|nr:hypothetical protein [bacterium]